MVGEYGPCMLLIKQLEVAKQLALAIQIVSSNPSLAKLYCEIYDETRFTPLP